MDFSNLISEVFSLKTLIMIPFSNDDKWQYPITKKMALKYRFSTAQKLLSFSFNISKHNCQIYFNLPPIPITPPNFNIVIPLISGNIQLGYFCYSTLLNIIVIAFTGSYIIDMWKADALYHQVAPTELYNYIHGMKVHSGLYRLYQTITPQLYKLLNQHINDKTTLYITGLSAGGAISDFCILDLYNRSIGSVKVTNIANYSFAAPIVFNTIGANHFNSLKMHSYHIINRCDIIPMFSLPIMPLNEDFTPIRKSITFTRNLKSYPANHVTSYLNHYKIQI